MQKSQNFVLLISREQQTTATASLSAPQPHYTMQVVEKIQTDLFLRTARGGHRRQHRLACKERMSHPCEESTTLWKRRKCSWSLPLRHKPGSVPLGSVDCLEESSSFSTSEH